MMYWKLAIQNIRRSLRDYIIYFVTLTFTALCDVLLFRDELFYYESFGLFAVLILVQLAATGCSTIFAQKGIPKMEQLSARLLLTAGILLLIAGVIFAILQVWLYTDLLWAGAFGCLLAALNFRDSKNDGG